MSKEPLDDRVTVFQDWNERDGKIYYRWKVQGEDEWHEKLTAHKEKPYVSFEVYPQAEWYEKRTKLESESKTLRKLANPALLGEQP